MPLVLGAQSATAAAVYTVDNSCMFDRASSSLLTKTPAGDGNKKTFTYSFWVKRSVLGYQATTVNVMAEASTAGLSFYQDDGMKFYIDASNGQTTNATFLDPMAWYHIVQAVDTTDGVAADRIKTYVNGVEVTSFSHKTNPSADTESRFNSSSYAMTISASGDSFGGYMAQVCFIDGLQLAASDFGEFSAVSDGSWIPKDISGLTFGTNGFLLDFADSADLGNDVSGNNNDYTVTNLDAQNQMTDTPTNNFPTINPLYKNQCTYKEGNLECTIAPSAFESGISTFGATTGKWYMEYKVTATASGVTRNAAGIVGDVDTCNSEAMGDGEIGYSPYSIGWSSGAVHKDSSSTGSFSAYGVGDICGIAMDLDNGKWYCALNNVWENSGVPTSGATGTGAIDIDITGDAGFYLFANTVYAASAFQCNYGNPPYSLTSAEADANGYGDFEYAPPTGYYAMCTKNLSEFG